MTVIQNDKSEECQCIFYNSPFCWADILICNTLKVLMVIGQNLPTLEGLQRLCNLNELWVVESSLKSANAIKKCKNLQKLYLYNNKLSVIPKVNQLKKLEILWLSGNIISAIENINGSQELKELNLANNIITEINSGFSNCDQLEVLNLSGNLIKNIFCVLELKNLSSLRQLQFYDPLYRITPIVKYVNYRSFIIMSLPQIKCLDCFEIHPDEKILISNYYSSKALHYSVEYHNELYIYFNEVKCRRAEQLDKLNVTLEKIFNTMMWKKMEKETYSMREQDEELKKLQEDIGTWKTENERRLKKLQHDLEIRNEQLQLEQQLFGNIKFIEINENGKVLTLLQNALQQYICPFVRSYLLDSIEVDRAVQVIDRTNVLKRIASLKAISNYIYSRGMEFLILNAPAGVEDSNDYHLLDFFSAHFQSKQTDLGKYSATDSIAIADAPWLNHASTQLNSDYLTKKNSKRMLILVFTLKTLEPKYIFNHARPLNIKGESCNHCHLYKVHSQSHIVPVFIVEYHYRFKGMEPTPQNSFKYKQSNRIVPIEYKCVQHCASFNVQSWQNLMILDLSRSFISYFGAVMTLPNVTYLNISFNKINNLQEISMIFPNLVTLTAPFNILKSIRSLAEMKYLKELDISSNKIRSFINTLTCLRKKTKNLLRLNIQYNPFVDIQKEQHMPYLAKMCFSNLQYFNKGDNKENEVKKIAVFHLDKTDKFKKNKLSEGEKLERNLQVIWNRDQCTIDVENNSYYEEAENTIQNHITVDHNDNPLCIYINYHETPFNSLLIKLNTINLRYLTITNTYMNSLEIPKTAARLEEIDLSFNMIFILRKVYFYTECLVRLNLMGNYLVRLDFFKEVYLPSLKYLNLSKNFLQSIEGIEHLTTLEEFYITSNLINDWNVLNFLKEYRNLKVFDVRGNLIENIDTLRKFLSYHLVNLKYMNGDQITEAEVEDAHIMFSGILNEDYLLKEYTVEKLNSLSELTVAYSSLRQITKLPEMVRITSVNLEHNNLTSFSSLAHLQNLKYLCLSNNQITSFGELTNMPAEHQLFFNNLEILHLSMNNITNLEKLELYRAPNLVSLFLHDNELTNIQGLNKLDKLKHLVLDRNKITLISPSEVSDLRNLKYLYIEYNHINSLKFLKGLKWLKSLFLAHNKIIEYETLQHLSHVTKVKELTVYGNPLCRFSSLYVELLYFLPHLDTLDGLPFDRTKLQLRIF